MQQSKNTFETPSSHEKMGYRMILDALNYANESKRHPENEPQLEISPEEMNLSPVAEAIIATPVNLQFTPLELTSEKKYFRIREVSELLKVESHVLRYWENEFRQIKPQKTGAGQRVYSAKDVQTLHLIKHLLYNEKFSIKGAKQQLGQRKTALQERINPVAPAVDSIQINVLKELAHDLKGLVRLARTTSTGIA